MQWCANSPSRKPHERMIANAESIEILLHVSFARGFKWLSVPIDDPNYAQSVQVGEKMCVAAMKCYIVGPTQRLLNSY
jgi:hypothetical protein